MRRMLYILTIVITAISSQSARSAGIQTEQLLKAISTAVSGERARDYTARLWLHERWSDFPAWKKSADEAVQIMKERGFDLAETVEIPADGLTKFGDWTSPVGWSCRQATLEVLEPRGIPDDIKYLCNYQKNPTSINIWSCPTHPEGIEAELYLLESVTPEELIKAKGKIILTDERAGGVGLNRFITKYGISGTVTDYIEDQNLVTANQWENQMSDIPLGWGHTQKDTKTFIFSISPEKGRFLRKLLRKGEKVVVRAKIDSKLYTDDTLPYVTGALLGNGAEQEEIFVAGHMYEHGANDNSSGVSSALEAIGVLNELIRTGILPKPKRTIRVWFGFEMYGSLPFVVQNLGRMQNKTIAALCLDTGAPDYDVSTTRVMMNPNLCPSFTDAIITDIVRTYYTRYSRSKWSTSPYSQGTDTYFCEPMIGVPSNALGRGGGAHIHHNSMDTIDKIDPRSLQDLSILEAVYLYYMANAGIDEVPSIADLTFNRCAEVILEKTQQIKNKIHQATGGTELGKVLSQGRKMIEYYSGLQKNTLRSIPKMVPPEKKESVVEYLSKYNSDIDIISKMCIEQINNTAKEKEKKDAVIIVFPEIKQGAWEREAASIIPKRKIVGTITLEGIPFEEWEEVSMSPRFYDDTNWASSSYWWCDGKRNLLQIKEFIEMDAEQPVQNFDLIKYYKFLKRHNLIEFAGE